jgi:phage I-like protein
MVRAVSRTITQSKRPVCAFRAVRAPAGFDPAQDFVVCPWGTIQTRKGPVTVNEHTLKVFAATQKAERRDKVAGDFSHNTLRGPEPIKVAGWWLPRVVANVGIVVSLYSVTPEIKMVTDGHYPDISPAIERNEKGEVEGLHSFAFVRHGEIDHPDLEIFSVESGAPTTPLPMTDSQMLAELITALTGEELPADATTEAKIAACAKAKSGGKLATDNKDKDKDAMTAEERKLFTDLTSSVTALAAQVTGLKSEVTAFGVKDAEREVDTLIHRATHVDRKQIGLKRERLIVMGAEGTREYLETLPSGVVKTDGGNRQSNNNVKGANTPGKTGKQTGTDVFGAEAAAMLKRNGMDPDKLAKDYAAFSADGTEAEAEEETESSGEQQPGEQTAAS